MRTREGQLREWVQTLIRRTFAMDNKQLVRLARLRSLAARGGHAFDLMRFVEDRSYAHQTLAELMTLDHEDLVVLALEVLNDLKQADEPAAAPVAPAAAAAAAVAPGPAPAPGPAVSAHRAAHESRYVGRLR